MVRGKWEGDSGVGQRAVGGAPLSPQRVQHHRPSLTVALTAILHLSKEEGPGQKTSGRGVLAGQGQQPSTRQTSQSYGSPFLEPRDYSNTGSM